MNHLSRRAWIAIGVIAAVGIAIGLGAALTFGAGSNNHTITGVVDVIDPGAKIANGTCTLSSNAPVGGGTKVEITNQDKQLLGSSELGPAKQMPGNKTGGCQFTFAVGGVPNASTYRVQIGTEGSASYSQSQLSDAGWAVSLNVSV
jgi:hypothetical protein